MDEVGSHAGCPEERTEGIEINLENCVEIQQFIFQCNILREFYDCYKKTRPTQHNEAHEETVKELKEYVRSQQQQKFDFYESVVQIRMVLAGKPPKSKVASDAALSKPTKDQNQKMGDATAHKSKQNAM